MQAYAGWAMEYVSSGFRNFTSDSLYLSAHNVSFTNSRAHINMLRVILRPDIEKLNNKKKNDFTIRIEFMLIFSKMKWEPGTRE